MIELSKVLNDFGAELIISRLNQNGYRCYYVGGCVRDAIMEKPINDYDLATDCLPQKIFEIFSNFTTFNIGLRYGTVSVEINGKVYEITTFRKEIDYRDNRRPNEVLFCSDLDIDLARRDFTCNALAFNKTQGLIDNFNGVYDIENRILRVVGNPYSCFDEDALRILRAVRFCSKLGFCAEENTRDVILEKCDLLKNISAERVFNEFKCILSGDFCAIALRDYREVIEHIIPHLKSLSEQDYNFLAIAVGKTNTIEVKLAIILSEFTMQTVEDILSSLKCDNKTALSIKELLKTKAYLYDTEYRIKLLLNELRGDLSGFFELKKAFAVASGSQEKLNAIQNGLVKTKRIIDNNECYSLRQLAVNGNDLLQIGYRGECVGDSLCFLLTAVMKGEVFNNKKDLLTYLEKKSSI